MFDLLIIVCEVWNYQKLHQKESENMGWFCFNLYYSRCVCE